MKILVADDDDVARHMILAALVSDGNDVRGVTSGEAAITAAITAGGPRLLLLDAHLKDLRDVPFRARLSERRDGEYVHVILLVDTSDQHVILRGLDAGADDVLPKPFSPEELIGRIHAAERMMQMDTAPSERLLHVLREAEIGESGEVIVRKGSVVGRVLFHGGQIAWIHVSESKRTPAGDRPSDTGATSSTRAFFDHIVEQGIPLDADHARSLLSDCNRQGTGFAEEIVRRGIATGPQVKAVVRDWLVQRLQWLLALESSEVIFIPQARRGAGQLTFSVEDLLSESRPSRPVAPPSSSDRAKSRTAWERAAIEMLPVEQDRLREKLAEALEIEGAESAAIYDAATGAAVGHLGKPVSEGVVEAQIKAMNLLGAQEDVEDMFITSGSRQYLLRAISLSPRWFFLLVLDRERATIALARLKVKLLATQIRAARDERPAAHRRSVSSSALLPVRPGIKRAS